MTAGRWTNGTINTTKLPHTDTFDWHSSMADKPFISPTRHDIYPFISPQRNLQNAARDRTILISGAGSGIGRVTSEIFAQASAANIVLVGRGAQKLQTVRRDLAAQYPSITILAESCDVASEASVNALFARLAGQNISIDILINNAGVAAEYSSIKDSDPSSWWRNHEIMLKGPYLMSRAYLRHRQPASPPGAILMTSTIGSYRLEPDMSSYCIPKTALNRLTEYVAAECASAENGVHCVAFHPGGVAQTELTAGAPPWLEELLSETGELAGGAALWLSMPEQRWLSGRYVDVRWDVEELEGLRGWIERKDALKIGLVGLEGYNERL